MSFDVASCVHCKRPHKWNAEEFLSARADIEKINIILCPSCLADSGTKAHWIPLKNLVLSHLRGKEQ